MGQENAWRCHGPSELLQTRCKRPGRGEPFSVCMARVELCTVLESTAGWEVVDFVLTAFIFATRKCPAPSSVSQGRPLPRAAELKVLVALLAVTLGALSRS